MVKVETPVILNEVPTILLDNVIVAIPAAPVVPVTESPVPKVNCVTLPEVPTRLLLESLTVIPLTAPEGAAATQVGALPTPFDWRTVPEPPFVKNTVVSEPDW